MTAATLADRTRKHLSLFCWTRCGSPPGHFVGTLWAPPSVAPQDNHAFPWHFTTTAKLPVGAALAGTWLSVAMGSYRIAGTVLGHTEQNDVREMFRIAAVEPAATRAVDLRTNLTEADAGGSVIRLDADPQLEWNGAQLRELQRPGRWFGGPRPRAFRIVTTAVDIDRGR